MDIAECSQLLWAKSNEKIRDTNGKVVGEKPNTWVPLIAHLIDVAACTQAILEWEGEALQRLYANDLGLELEAVVPWVAALGGLHDLGKAFPAFQIQWKPGINLIGRGGFTWEASQTDGKPPGHGVVSQVLLEELLVQVGIAKETACNMADAIGAHHGFRASTLERKMARQRKGDGLWDEARGWLWDAILQSAKAKFHPSPKALELEGVAFMRLAGLVSLADWIGSNRRWFDAGRDASNPENLFQDSLLQARKALVEIGWPSRENKLPGFAELFGFEPRGLQVVTINILESQAEPTLLLIEAPMGEGKTEAALYAHLMLQTATENRGFYVALPTQATGNAMFKRVKENYLIKLGYQQPPDFQLIHGAAILDKRFQKMKLQVGENPKEAVVAREWFSQKKHGLVSPHAVGTVDQALLGILNASHQFVRLWGLGNRTIILDEVHAYELYTSILIERLVFWLKALGSSVILLSATLPQRTRERLLKAYGSTGIQTDKPYPRITRVNQNGTLVEDLEARRLEYKLEAAPIDVPSLAQFLSDQSQGGGAVGCIVNTVQRAQDLFKELKKLKVTVPVRLIHARFPSSRRQRLERWASFWLGKYIKQQRNVIVIGTQLLEQSLDIDFDVLVSDLAPIDLLLQRAGRLHRHPRIRPGRHREARFYVSGLQPDAQTPDISSYYWDYVYSPTVLYRTWAVLKGRQQLVLPDNFRDTEVEPSLLEQVYSPDPLGYALSDEFKQALLEAEAKLTEETNFEDQLAKTAALPKPDSFFDRAVNDDKREDDDDPTLNQNLRAATRLGDPSVSVVFLHKREGNLHLADGTRVSLDKEPNLYQAKRLLENAVSISNKTLFWHLVSKPIKAWEDNTLLRNARVVELEKGVYSVSEKFRVCLEEELGVVYERSGG